LIYACSGAANVAEIADRAARELSGVGEVKMFCLAGIGAGIQGMVQTARDADANIVIDGCDLDCAKKIFDKAGLDNYRQTKVTDLGIRKDGTPVTDEQVKVVVDKVGSEIASA
jgi:uncharacterized metal-binding protein